jgi:hypothetical protein
MRTSSFIFLFSFLLTVLSTNTFAKLEGFYKDVFQDEGTQINGADMKTNCEYIEFTMEHLDTKDNKTKQAEIMIKNPNDDNGI